VIVVVLTSIGVASALWSPARVRRIAAVSLRHMGLVWIALVLQLVLFEYLARRIPGPLTEVLHYATYALCGAFLVVNRRLPGVGLIAAGAASNLVAISLNGGSMPADPDAWARAGLPPVPAGTFENSAANGGARLSFLGDVFAIPESWPLSNVFSIGDVLIVIGGTWFAHRWCARRADDDMSPGRPVAHEATSAPTADLAH
jgi:hypothetical protein